MNEAKHHSFSLYLSITIQSVWYSSILIGLPRCAYLAKAGLLSAVSTSRVERCMQYNWWIYWTAGIRVALLFYKLCWFFSESVKLERYLFYLSIFIHRTLGWFHNRISCKVWEKTSMNGTSLMSYKYYRKLKRRNKNHSTNLQRWLMISLMISLLDIPMPIQINLLTRNVPVTYIGNNMVR